MNPSSQFLSSSVTGMLTCLAMCASPIRCLWDFVSWKLFLWKYRHCQPCHVCGDWVDPPQVLDWLLWNPFRKRFVWDPKRHGHKPPHICDVCNRDIVGF